MKWNMAATPTRKTEGQPENEQGGKAVSQILSNEHEGK